MSRTCHYCFSALIVGKYDDASAVEIRSNSWGPWRDSEIKAPAETFFSGDSVWRFYGGYTRSGYKDMWSRWFTGWSYAHPSIGANLDPVMHEWVPAIGHTHTKSSAAFFDGHCADLDNGRPYDSGMANALAKKFMRVK